MRLLLQILDECELCFKLKYLTSLISIRLAKFWRTWAKHSETHVG